MFKLNGSAWQPAAHNSSQECKAYNTKRGHLSGAGISSSPLLPPTAFLSFLRMSRIIRVFGGPRVCFSVLHFVCLVVVFVPSKKKGVCVSLCVWAGLCVSCVCPCVSLCVLPQSLGGGCFSEAYNLPLFLEVLFIEEHGNDISHISRGGV